MDAGGGALATGCIINLPLLQEEILTITQLRRPLLHTAAPPELFTLRMCNTEITTSVTFIYLMCFLNDLCRFRTVLKLAVPSQQKKKKVVLGRKGARSHSPNC